MTTTKQPKKKEKKVMENAATNRHSTYLQGAANVRDKNGKLCEWD